MDTNYNSNNASRWLQRCLSVVCISAFFLVDLPGPHAQTVIRATSTNTNSAVLRANGKIAFTSDRDGNREIYLMNSDGTNQVRITNNAGADDFPAWSPDGKRLAILSQNAAGNYVIKLMNADGTDQKELTSVVSYGNFDPFEGPRWGMSWSPDGTKIAYDNGGISIINVDGSNPVNVSNGSHPSWSPDGSRIVFCTYSGGGYYGFRLWTMNADGSNQIPLPGGSTGNYTQDVDPTWSPDGMRIAGVQQWFLDVGVLFIRNLSGTWEFQDWTTDRDSSSPAWSPDGTKIAYSAVIWPYAQYRNVEIFVINADGSGLMQLTDTGGYEAHPAWQPLAPEACPNPIDCAEFFVHQHYLDFLNREPDQGGWDYWTARITECGNDPLCVHQRRIDVSGAFFVELEFQETGYVVYRLHRAAYGEVITLCIGGVDLEGNPCEPRSRANITRSQFLTDRAQLVGGPDLPQSTINFANSFVQRPEFKQAYPEAMTPSDFVNKLFDTANLTGSANASLRQMAIDALTNGSKTRAQVLLDLIEINEFKTREYNPAFVLMQYFGYLRRDPDEGGYYFWLDVLNNREPNNFRGMICAFITSIEYQRRFGTVASRTNQDCAQ
jgi:hypothetical protein